MENQRAESGVLVTGGLGFVGRHLVQFLASKGYGLYALTRQQPSSVPSPHPGVTVLQTDWSSKNLTETMMRIRPGYVVHLAGQVDVASSWQHPAQLMETNVVLSIRLLDAIRSAGVNSLPRVLMVGSMHEYSLRADVPMPLTESSASSPVNPYGFSKLVQSTVAAMYAKLYGLPIVTARVFNLCGPGGGKGVFGQLVRRAAELGANPGAGCFTVGSPVMARDFLDVRDAVRAFWDLMQVEPYPSGDVFNVCSGTAVRLGELAQMLNELTGSTFSIREAPSLVRGGEPIVAFGSSEKLTRITGWRPLISIRTSLADALEQMMWEGEIGS